MKLSNFIAGLNILKPYYDGEYVIGAEHDQFFAYATDRPLTPQDVQRMQDLDWFQPETNADEDYNPDDGWSAFV